MNTENKDLDVKSDTSLVEVAESFLNYEIPDEFQEKIWNGTDGVRIDDFSVSHEAEELQTGTKDRAKETEQKKIDHVSEETSKFMKPMLHRNSNTYDIHKFDKNVVFIFNQENFDKGDPRKGTQKDVDALKNSFGTIGFQVEEPFNDFTRKEILEKLEHISRLDFTDYGCLVMIFLTHGSSHGELSAKDSNFCESDVLQYFKGTNNDSLLSKPKIFIIQACRGEKVSDAAFPGKSASKVQHDACPHSYSYNLPAEADFLVIHSTYAGNVSYRHEKDGSWFIQTLCEWIKESPNDMEINVMLTRIKQKVAINKEHVTQQINKQIPIYYTTLTRDLYLKEQPVDKAREQEVTCLDTRGNTCEYPPVQNSSNVNGSLMYKKLMPASENCAVCVSFRRQYFKYLRVILLSIDLSLFAQETNIEEHGRCLINIANAIGPYDDSRDQTARQITMFLKNNAGEWVDFSKIFLYDEYEEGC